MAAKTHRLVPGSTFAERFSIERAIGEGAMGTVYRAVDEGGLPCALKVLKASAQSSPKAEERFAREALVGRRIGCPYVVEVQATGYDEPTGLHWLAMELVDGVSLSEWIEAAEPPMRERVLRQIFEAMAAAHAAGVIHRDLKPENIMVTGGHDASDVKVLDFGVAKTFRPSLGASSTEGGLGTPLWAAPEQGHGGIPEPSVDVWALGLLAFYLLTGKVYWWHYQSGSMLDLAVEMLKEALAPASERAQAFGVGERLPTGFDAWFARAVCRAKEERFVDAVEARDALVALLDHGDVGPSIMPPSAVASTAGAPRARWPWAVALGLLMVALAVVLVLVL